MSVGELRKRRDTDVANFPMIWNEWRDFFMSLICRSPRTKGLTGLREQTVSVVGIFLDYLVVYVSTSITQLQNLMFFVKVVF